DAPRPPLTMLVDALLLFVLFVAWGAQATVPWRLSGAATSRRLWRAAALPLALAGLLAAYELADRNPDAAVATSLVPLLASIPGRLLAVLVPALLAGALLGGLGGDRLGVAGERLTAALGLAACTAAAWAGELLRAGEGPEISEPRFLLLIGCRLALMLAAGELPLLARPRWAAAGGIALLLYLPLLPAPLRAVLWHQGLWLTCGAAGLLLLTVRWLPRALRLPAFAAGVLLAAIVLSQAGHVSQALAPGVDYQEFPVLH
ncbi:MAG TPA: hypothetical protein VJA16_13095, partial [Thermoanaerobaculia bacterium]